MAPGTGSDTRLGLCAEPRSSESPGCCEGPFHAMNVKCARDANISNGGSARESNPPRTPPLDAEGKPHASGVEVL